MLNDARRGSMWRRTSFSWAAVALLAAAGGCQCGVNPWHGNQGLPSDGGDGSEQPGGTHDGGGVAPFPKEQACKEISQQATLESKPVDIVMVIDNSSSMTAEIQAVETNVNVNFSQIIEESGVDYRVILIAKHGSAAADQSVCIRAPLSGTTCNPIPSKPVNGARFFHYDIEISSTNSLSRILSTYDATDTHGFAPGGWKNWLRTGSFKIFIEITDDESSINADSFESQLFAKAADGAFGDAVARNYVFHSIVGIVPNAPADKAWEPTDPRKNEKCSSAAKAGAVYEDLSIRTGGLRFPVCETASYDAVFRAAAQSVINSAEVSCEFSPGAPPLGSTYHDAYLEYLPGGTGPARYLLPRKSGEACSDGRLGLDLATGRITLCPEACALIKADEAAKISVLFACAAQIG
jgi:hypothetical protein